MDAKRAKALWWVYCGELFGIEAFGVAANRGKHSDQRRQAGLLRDLEVQTERMLREHMLAAGAYPRGTVSRVTQWLHSAAGTILGRLSISLPWSWQCRILALTASQYLPVFERLERHASEGERPLFSYLVEHERALIAFARAAGTGDVQAGECVARLLVVE